MSGAHAFPDGAPWGAANPGAEQHCAACHFESEAVHESPALTLVGLPQNLEASVTYELSVAFNDPGIVIAGFQLIAVAPDENAGTFTSSAEDVEFIGASIRSTAPVETSGRAIWAIRWRTPTMLTDSIVLHVAASAANDDGSPFGDTIHYKSYEISTRQTGNRN